MYEGRKVSKERIRLDITRMEKKGRPLITCMDTGGFKGDVKTKYIRR